MALWSDAWHAWPERKESVQLGWHRQAFISLHSMLPVRSIAPGLIAVQFSSAPIHPCLAVSTCGFPAACNYWGSAPPPRAKPAEPPRSTAALRLRSTFSITGVQHPSTSIAGGASPLNGFASLALFYYRGSAPPSAGSLQRHGLPGTPEIPCI